MKVKTTLEFVLVPLLIALIEMQGMMNQRPRENYEEDIQLGITVHLPGIHQGLVRRGPRAQQWWQVHREPHTHTKKIKLVRLH